MADFIVTETYGQAGEAAEGQVFDAVKAAFARRDALGFWRYPLTTRDSAKEPDILIADPEYGLVVIEVKNLPITDIAGIAGYRWDLRRPYFGKSFINPYEQARRQVQLLIDLTARRSELARVPARALVALPQVTREQWEAAGFDGLLQETPLLLGDELTSARVLRAIERAPLIRYGNPLDEGQWRALRSALGTSGSLPGRAEPVPLPSRPLLGRHGTPVPAAPARKIDLLRQAQTAMKDFDLQQELIAKTIPPGPQRIRGIAGSGKTVLLAQKAANMHLKHPEWDIALVFFCRSLYDQICRQVDHWLRHASGGERTLQGARHKLRILHAWGAKEQPGFYRTLAQHVGVPPLHVGNTPDGSPGYKLLYACKALISDAERLGRSLQVFDAVLIDEGQDLVHEDETLRHEDKQAFYWLAHESLKPVPRDVPLFSEATPAPELRRLIWAYDEAQSLDTLAIPTARALFGEKLAKALNQGVTYRGGIKKSEVMHRCYRTPGPILLAAHALGMGLLREQGMLAGLTQQEHWQKIGYEVTGAFRAGQEITLRRPPEHSPNPLTTLPSEPLVTFHSHRSRDVELGTLVEAIKRNLGEDGLVASRHILVVVLGGHPDAKMLQARVFGALRHAGLDAYIPGNRDINVLHQPYPNNDPNGFWRDGAVTVSPVMQAKGNEADVVYVVGLDHIAKAEDDLRLRNQLFVALSRSRGWAHLSGVGMEGTGLAGEVRRVLDAGNVLTFRFQPPKRHLDDGE
ncbi:DEAD/DEAH box helicase [Deinococcus pimensis]|uniref:DEAD/DEAH box helicase n=1 Tax=Deinococcus pimensis TaxID=309888 RepID=UPI0004833467|nr:nuclease-related domain-containing DEAD/DEAH box helicase [Deinococcus pimensis]